MLEQAEHQRHQHGDKEHQHIQAAEAPQLQGIHPVLPAVDPVQAAHEADECLPRRPKQQQRGDGKGRRVGNVVSAQDVAQELLYEVRQGRGHVLQQLFPGIGQQGKQRAEQGRGREQSQEQIEGAGGRVDPDLRLPDDVCQVGKPAVQFPSEGRFIDPLHLPTAPRPSFPAPLSPVRPSFPTSKASRRIPRDSLLPSSEG